MKNILTAMLLIFSGLFVHHSQVKTIGVLPTTTISPTPTASPSPTQAPTIIYYPTNRPTPTTVPLSSNCKCTPNECTCPAIAVPGCTSNCNAIPTQTVQQQLDDIKTQLQQIKRDQ